MQHTHPSGTVHRLWWSDFETEQTSKKTPSWVSSWRQLRVMESNPTQHLAFCLAGSQTPRALWDFPACFLISPGQYYSISMQKIEACPEWKGEPASFVLWLTLPFLQAPAIWSLPNNRGQRPLNAHWDILMKVTKERWSWEHRHLLREYLSK